MRKLPAGLRSLMSSQCSPLLHGFGPGTSSRLGTRSFRCVAGLTAMGPASLQVQRESCMQKSLIMPSAVSSLARIKSGSGFSSQGGINVADWAVVSKEDSSESRLLLVDGKALVYRAYYKISWATFRHVLFPEYKSQREMTPDTVRQAVRDTKHAVLAMGVKVLEVPGVEADDVIGTLASQALEAGMKVRIASQDKDFFQILSPDLRLLRYQPKGSKLVSFGLNEFRERFPGIEVSQFVDVGALVGDAADNIPGVRGIGDISARKLISEFGTLENLLDNRDQITNGRVRNSLLLDQGEALLSKNLLTLKVDVPGFAMGCNLQNLRCKEPKDGGKSYMKLIWAFQEIVGDPVGISLLEQTRKVWHKLS